MLLSSIFLLCLWCGLAHEGKSPGQTLIHERLTYSMRYGHFHAGHFETEVISDSENDIALRATLRTPALYRKFFWVDNLYVSEVDTALRPRCVRKEIRQKNIAHTISYVFDFAKGVARTSDGRQWQAPVGTRDILSLVYHLRKWPLAPGEKRSYILDGEGLTWPLTAENLGCEEVEVPAGKCTADKVVLRVVGPAAPGPRAWKTDILTNRLSGATSGVFIWFCTGEGRAPVQMLFRASPFDLHMTLEECTGTSISGGGE